MHHDIEAEQCKGRGQLAALRMQVRSRGGSLVSADPSPELPARRGSFSKGVFADEAPAGAPASVAPAIASGGGSGGGGGAPRQAGRGAKGGEALSIFGALLRRKGDVGAE